MRYLAALALTVATLGTTAAISPTPAMAQVCGHYIVLGCMSRNADAVNRMNQLGGPGIGGAGVAGSFGTQIIHTNDFPNFRNGFFCVVDGPYYTAADAQSIAWNEAVRDAYVKKGC
ncbi:MAG: hypothetical protein AAF638_10540 [Pseudomonadota bacterium]